MKTITNKSSMVRQMRTIRDTFSLEIMNMSFEQEKEFIKMQLADLKSKRIISNTR
jgi:hypothetical protein